MSSRTRYFRAKLFAGLYLFTVTALAINLFMVGLLWQAVGWPALSPITALAVSFPAGLAVNWLVMRWVERLLDEAEH